MSPSRRLLAVLPLVAVAWAAQAGADQGGCLRVPKKLLRADRYAEAAKEARACLRAAPRGKPAAEVRAVLCQARGHLSEELPAPDGPLRIGGQIQPPEKIAGGFPPYTKEAKEARTHGTVVVNAIIDQEGCVRDVQLVRGLPHGLSEQAVANVRTWVFEPATLGGQPVKVYYTLTVTFQVE